MCDHVIKRLVFFFSLSLAWEKQKFNFQFEDVYDLYENLVHQ